MANYEAYVRSNYFRVKNEAAFRQWAEGLRLDVPVDEKMPDGEQRFAIYSNDVGGWPQWREPERDEAGDEVDFVAELQDHLADDDVAILLEVGHEKLRYLGGSAQVCTPQEIRSVNLTEEAMRIARELSGDRAVTSSEY